MTDAFEEKYNCTVEYQSFKSYADDVSTMMSTKEYGDEKIGATGKTLATDNLVLDDDKDFVAYEPFAAMSWACTAPIHSTTCCGASKGG